MNSLVPRIRSRRATLMIVVLLLSPIYPVDSVLCKRNPSRCPAEEIPSLPVGNPVPQYQKVDYSFPLSAADNPRLYVFKANRRLLVLHDDILIRDYPIGLGPCAVGDKRKRGDGRTPEGDFYVCEKNPRSKYHKSLGISYPGERHAYQALLTGLLSYRNYKSILKAHEEKKRPPWNTPLGGEICIHGGGAHEDWTKGCVALYNYDMDELFEIVTMGTPVFILP